MLLALAAERLTLGCDEEKLSWSVSVQGRTTGASLSDLQSASSQIRGKYSKSVKVQQRHLKFG